MEQKAKATNSIVEGVIWKSLLAFFFPILLGTFFQQMYNTVDSVVVGNFVGKEALAAVGGSAAQILNLLIGFFTSIGSGATVVVSQYYGADDADGVHRAVHTAIAASVAETATAAEKKDDPQAAVVATSTTIAASTAVAETAAATEKKDDPQAAVIAEATSVVAASASAVTSTTSTVSAESVASFAATSTVCCT